ncbi:PLP-dependent aminotransferase family protein [Azoarcus sp. L1K30]|uniref:MocR-like pyridoxine biosynthesis transcription factor PdxR n=1 Tax=Azoarcus sp. L1K30 TaxID=2820277 RepID=UPI001B832D29|nr:PLP-dependent aminotransferase family protein [Azoarcus sp. L1K30]MBR0567402.1 PLP-dependent aminotransferase family protein [Azoarcus sp. L1K30]
MALDWLLAAPLPPAVPRQRLLYQRLRDAILCGRIAAGTRLPASRRLAAELGIARNSVMFAYEQLVAEACLVADRHGTRVAALPALAADSGRTHDRTLPGLSQRAAAAMQPEVGRDAETLPFAPGVPDLAGFPFRSWRASLDRAWREASTRQLGHTPYGGEPALRAALAGQLSTVRGFAVKPEQIVITGGTQSGLDLCARLLADSGDTAWVENPGYLAARAALNLAGLKVHAVAVDGEGLAPGEGDWQAHPPRLIMVTPSHQYPTGQVMSLARRLTLIERARAEGAWIIEDDYDSEFRRGGPALPAIYGVQHDAPVVYAGTFSKTLYPGLRIGYLVLPSAVADDFVRAAGQATRPGQGIEQAALADFIRRGHYTTHLRRMRKRYALRQRALRAALAAHPGAEVRVSGGEAGLHLVLWLPQERADVEVEARANRLGLGVRALSRYAQAPVRCNGLVLGYGNIDEAQIDGLVRRLRQAMAV